MHSNADRGVPISTVFVPSTHHGVYVASVVLSVLVLAVGLAFLVWADRS
jgi:hypothetical protein